MSYSSKKTTKKAVTDSEDETTAENATEDEDIY